MLLLALLYTTAPPFQLMSQNINDPVARQTTTLLVDYIDHFGFEIGRSRTLQGFGVEFGAFNRIEGAGLNGSSAARLSTGVNGFSTPASFIGFLESFAIPIDASAMSRISYWARSEGNDNSSTVAISLTFGNHSQWQQKNPTALTASFQRTSLSLNEENFIRVGLGSGDNAFDHSQIIEVALLMFADGQPTGGQKSAVFDDIILTDSAYLLAVKSSPVPVSITSSQVSRSTPFNLTDITDGASVTLSAPVTTSTSNGDFGFRYWQVDNVIQPQNLHEITIPVYHNSSATAVYKSLNPAVSVTAKTGNNHIDGIHITGSHPGITAYQPAITLDAHITLSAPPQYVDNNTTLSFIRWSINNVDQPFRQTTIAHRVADDTSFVALYGSGRMLVVTSFPDSALSIQIDGIHRVTDFFELVASGSTTTLNAPGTMTHDGKQIQFVSWQIRGSNGESVNSANPVTIDPVDADMVATAVYETIIDLNREWNLISTPVINNTLPINQLITDPLARSAVWKWTGKRFETVPVTKTLQVHTGYWIFNDGPQTNIKPTGTAPIDPLLPSVPGWNLIGIGGYHPIKVPSSLAAMGIIWRWDNQLQQFVSIFSDLLPEYQKGILYPGMGYWLYGQPQHP